MCTLYCNSGRLQSRLARRVNGSDYVTYFSWLQTDCNRKYYWLRFNCGPYLYKPSSWPCQASCRPLLLQWSQTTVSGIWQATILTYVTLMNRYVTTRCDWVSPVHQLNVITTGWNVLLYIRLSDELRHPQTVIVGGRQEATVVSSLTSDEANSN